MKTYAAKEREPCWRWMVGHSLECERAVVVSESLICVYSYSGQNQHCWKRSVCNKTCLLINLLLNTSKTKKMVIDFRKHKGEPVPLNINWDCAQRVSSFKFLGTHTTEDRSWTANASAVVKKAWQRLHFLRILRRNHLEENLLVAFYRSTIESVLTYCITAWYAHCFVADRKNLQRVIKTTQHITGSLLPSLDDIASTRCLRRAITADPSHPGQHLLDLGPSGRRYRCLKRRTNRLKNCFLPRAIRTLNS